MTLQRIAIANHNANVVLSPTPTVHTTVQALSGAVDTLDALIKELHAALLPVMRPDDTVRAMPVDTDRKEPRAISDLQSNLRSILESVEGVDANIRAMKSRLDL